MVVFLTNIESVQFIYFWTQHFRQSITLPASRLRERHCHRWVHFIDTTKITVLRFVWDCLVFTQYIYYREFFCSWPPLRLHNRHCHMWVRYIDTTIITVWCMSPLLFSIDLWLFCYLIKVYFKLTNGKVRKWWMVKWCIGEIKTRIGRFVSHKYWICSFVLFSDTTFI